MQTKWNSWLCSWKNMQKDAPFPDDVDFFFYFYFKNARKA